MFRIWLVLFGIFIGYTLLVYYYCDAPAKPAYTPDRHVLAGWSVWQSRNCQACHQIYGLGGYLGPDLTNVASEPGKDSIYMRTFIRFGTGRMPNFNLCDSDINNLVAFLKWVDKSGRSRVSATNVTWTGNYNLEN